MNNQWVVNKKNDHKRFADAAPGRATAQASKRGRDRRDFIQKYLLLKDEKILDLGNKLTYIGCYIGYYAGG